MAPTSSDLKADREILITIQSLPDYSPRHEIASPVSLRQLGADLDRADEAELIARRAHEVAREQQIQARIALHNAVLTAKAEVVGQYGADSPALHAVGRKQRSERRRPTRREMPAEE